MKKIFNRLNASPLVTLVILAALVSACTEDRMQKQMLKYEVYPKTMIDTSAEYLYVPSTLSASRHSEFGQAYTMGEERIVKLELGEFKLNVYGVEKEEKFSDNPSNKRLIMSIPVEHVDYRCADDAFGECMSQEVQNDRIDWTQRKFFIPKFDQTVFADLNFLPSALPDGCYDVKNSKLISRKLAPDSINFRLERNYQTNLFFFCSRGVDSLENYNWSDISHYSIVKLNTVASADYKAAVYNQDWISTFGFFEEERPHLDIDGNSTQDLDHKYINRWNPERDSVVYHLSPEFDKAENAVLKSATYESFNRLNQGLEKAGVKFRLQLQEPDPAVDPGDLRNNMVILAEDPFEASVIGYGPSVTNPKTGEIISARTVMYLGSLKKFIRYTYDEILLQQKKISQAALNAAAQEGTPANSQAGAEPSVEISENLIQMASKADALSLHASVQTDASIIQDITNFFATKNVSRTPSLGETDLERAADIARREDRIAKLSEQGKYPAEMLEFGDVSQDMIQELIFKIGELKPWEHLSTEQKQQVIDHLVPYAWVPTLVHEIGHNLGLRHNFSGSEDGANFYSNAELQSQNLPVSSKNVPYSSIMDYPKSEINALRTLGKYDIAALRFGYRFEVENADGSLTKVDPAQAKPGNLKVYDYCTDSGVALNPNCNPFDEGLNLREITQSLIDSYHDRYLRSNFRRGRANFSSFDDDFYYSSLNRTFRKLRLLFERYQDIIIKFQQTEQQIATQEWLKDIDESVVIAADFMMDVIAQPDIMCLLRTQQGFQVFPVDTWGMHVNDLTRECSNLGFDPAQIQVVGQTGKSLNSYKLPSNPNIYIDQIDVRGVWIDKAHAMQALFQRRMFDSSLDDYNGNFMDHPKVGPRLKTFLTNLLNDQVQANVTFDLIDGTQLKTPFSYTMAPRPGDIPTYAIPPSELPIVNRVLGTRYDNMHLVEVLTNILVRGLDNGASSTENSDLRSELMVYSEDPGSAAGPLISARVGGRTLYAEESSVIAANLMKSLQVSRVFERVPLESLQKIQELHANTNAADPAKQDAIANLSTAERAAFNLGAEPLQKYMAGDISTSGFYEPILRALARNP